MAEVDVLFAGYVGERVAGTVSVVLTHLWWSGDIAPDPKAVDADAVRRNRERVLELATLIVPGHGPAFAAADAPVWHP